MALAEECDQSGDGMHVGPPELHTEHGQITWSVPVGGLRNVPESLWFSLTEEYAGLVTELADPAVIGLLIPAMHAGKTMEIEGRVTDELAHSLTHGYQHILEAVVPNLSRVVLATQNMVPAGDPTPGVGTGFSAGVDSYTVLAEHHFMLIPKDLRLTHLTYFNVGSHGSGKNGRDVFRKRCGLLAPIAEEIGLPFVAVDSNLDDFYTFSDFQQTNGPRNLSAASLLQGGIGRYYFASSTNYRHVGVRRIYDTAFSDPISLPLLVTRQFRPISHGDQYTRVEKTLIVTDTPVSHTSLNVCVMPLPDGGNCSRCLKCLRTALTLEIAGRLEDYRQVFDLDTYRKHRAAYLDWVVGTRSNRPAAEIRDYARQAGFQLPSLQMAVVRRGPRVVIPRARSLGRRIFARIRKRRQPLQASG